MTRFKKYRWFVWLCFPLSIGLILSGGVFYGDGPRAAPAWRVFYGALVKTAFSFIICTYIISSVFKLEGVYRGILEWRGFAWSGRVSYGVFLLHTLLQRGYVANATTPLHMNDFIVLLVLGGTTFFTFLLAAIMWVCVEAPVAALTKAALTPPPHDGTKV